ncbi:Aldose 1-epimerase [Parvibaculum lavamentivorans DS-1]|uniref:Aldose 1-epimerase n=2 Tax=Parvibaculum lavamentivorans TaxID=256618 RepID=A7HUB8_PARL1|nr:Aldose 1-epimerase [Parvibaculum lavamentivorans DS-1]
MYLPAVHRTGCGSRTSTSQTTTREAGTLAAANHCFARAVPELLPVATAAIGGLARAVRQCRLRNQADRNAACLLFEQTPIPDADFMLTLAHSRLEAVLAPETGGCIARFSLRHDGGIQQLLRPLAHDHASPGPLDMACYPLVPFSGRITNGRFRFGAEDVALPPDPICVPHAIHGRGWRAPWEVLEASANTARLRFVHKPEDAGGWSWPWSFETEQHFSLGLEGLSVAMRLTNLSSAPMPGGLGLHPFFNGRASARLQARLPEVWESGPDGTPTGLAPVPEKWRFDEPRDMKDVDVDHCFSRSEGRFRVDWTDRPFALRIEATGAPHAIVYAPPGEDFFCAEPVSHAPDAVNRPEREDVTGLRTLVPGETMELLCRFLVEEA